MRVLLYSHAFPPSTGGVETVSMQLATGFAARGITCKVVTRTAEAINGPGFHVYANPDKDTVRALVKWADVVLFNGASLALQPWVTLYRKPSVWVHVGYQTACIDGAGWMEGAPAPRTPWASVKHHTKRYGIRYGVREGLKLAVRRFVAKHLITRHVAITKWMLEANPLPRQVHIYNPFPTRMFSEGPEGKGAFDFVFVGRLVTEKGVDVLLRALSRVPGADLLIVGDGPERGHLKALAKELGLDFSRVVFVGTKKGSELVFNVKRAKVGIVPSTWAEPMGGVVVELMAAGLPVIVSREGGLAECICKAGLTFRNGDCANLAEAMELMRRMGPQPMSDRARMQAKAFDPEKFIDQYVSMLREIAPRAAAFHTNAIPEERAAIARALPQVGEKQ